MLKHVETGVLHVAYEESGAPGGPPVMLLHGFPYDAHAYDEVAPLLAGAGCRVFKDWANELCLPSEAKEP